MFQCKQVDGSYLGHTRASGDASVEMAVSAEQAFATLEDGPAWTKWMPVITGVDWTSPKPYGEGTTRRQYSPSGFTVQPLSAASFLASASE